MEELPGDLKGDEGLAGAGGEREQDAILAGGNGLQHALDGDVLVVAAGMMPPLSSNGTAAKRSRQAFALAKVRFQSSSGVGYRAHPPSLPVSMSMP